VIIFAIITKIPLAMPRVWAAERSSARAVAQSFSSLCASRVICEFPNNLNFPRIHRPHRAFSGANPHQAVFLFNL
jgi:hypothetical protein